MTDRSHGLNALNSTIRANVQCKQAAAAQMLFASVNGILRTWPVEDTPLLDSGLRQRRDENDADDKKRATHEI
jgi:hypothetical protein